VAVTGRKLGGTGRANPTRRDASAWFINYKGAHQGTVYATSKRAALAQARKKWGKGPYTAVLDRG
jgi:hypothetical protein